MDVRNCEFCGIEFISRRKNMVYCSHECANKQWNIDNRDRKRELVRKYNKLHKEIRYKKHKEWYRKKYGTIIEEKRKQKEIKRETRCRRNTVERHDITLEQYNSIFDKQSGCCAICGKHQSEFKRNLAVDHDHKTGKIRGLLCHKCNLLLGYSSENIDVLNNSINYLKKINVFDNIIYLQAVNMRSIHTTIKSVEPKWSYQPEFDNTTGGTVLMGT